MTYNVVIPSTWAPYRQDLNDILTAIIAGFQTAVPNVIRKQWSEIPPTYTGEVPLVYLGDIIEHETFTGGTTWNQNIDGAGIEHILFEGVVVYVDVSPDNSEANTRANTFADYMRRVFAVNARVYPPGILAQTGIREGAVSEGPMRGFMQLTLDYTFTIQVGQD